MTKQAEITEFFEGRKIRAYKCPAGIWTIGVGHTFAVKPTDIWSESEIDIHRDQDLLIAEKRVDKVVSILLTEWEKAALISQAFNLRSFEKLANHLNKSKELYKQKTLQYCYDIKNKKWNGLLIRRICERLLFENREWRTVALDLQSVNKLKYTEEIKAKLFL